MSCFCEMWLHFLVEIKATLLRSVQLCHVIINRICVVGYLSWAASQMNGTALCSVSQLHFCVEKAEFEKNIFTFIMSIGSL